MPLSRAVLAVMIGATLIGAACAPGEAGTRVPPSSAFPIRVCTAVVPPRTRGISKPDPGGAPGLMEGANATLLAALASVEESRLTLMLAGHIHNFQIENYGGGAAPQLVVGEGGDTPTDLRPWEESHAPARRRVVALAAGLS